MKILLSFLIFIMTACNSIYGDSSAMMNTLNNYVNLRINNKEYKLILYDNDTARDFLKMLPFNYYNE